MAIVKIPLPSKEDVDLLKVENILGEYVNITAVEDDEGKYVLRVVDAAPHAPQEHFFKTRQQKTTVIDSMSSEVVTITPTSGYLAKITYIGVNIPAIATATGSHFLNVYVGSDFSSAVDNIIQNTATAQTQIRLVGGQSASHNTGRDSVSSTLLLNQLVFDSLNPLNIRYINESNLAQTGTRFYVVQYLEWKVRL